MASIASSSAARPPRRAPTSRRGQFACSTPSPPAARSRRADAKRPILEWATNVDWTRGKHAIRSGSLVEGGWYESDNRTNYLGTFTFTSLRSYEAGQPANYTQRLGNPLVEYPQWQAGLFIQDDWRARSNLTLSAGLRQEFQTHLDDHLNLSPRASFTWSPFKHGKTTVRGGGGIFYEWLDPEVYEQTLRVDGVRQRDLVITQPRLSRIRSAAARRRRSCRPAATCSPTTW